MFKIIHPVLSLTERDLLAANRTFAISQHTGHGAVFLLEGLDYPIADPHELLRHSIPMARKHFLSALNKGQLTIYATHSKNTARPLCSFFYRSHKKKSQKNT